MKIIPKSYSSFKTFFEDIILPTDLSKELSYGFAFRGESSSKYKLLPSALREHNSDKLEGSRTYEPSQANWELWQIHKENELLREFYLLADGSGLKVPVVPQIRDELAALIPTPSHINMGIGYTWPSKSILELGALAQHYGVLTRFLDWTYDILTALYFASSGAIKKFDNLEKGENIVIWAINVNHIQSTTSRMPLKFVIPPYADNPNLNAQKGLLSFWETSVNNIHQEILKPTLINRTPIDELLAKEILKSPGNDHITCLYKFEFPASDCIEVYERMKALNHTASHLFPGYDGVKKQMEEDILYYKLVNRKNIDS